MSKQIGILTTCGTIPSHIQRGGAPSAANRILTTRLGPVCSKMVSRKVRAKQFLILDEPFAFFDKERTEHALSLLPKLSDDLPQIWVIDQSFPQSMKFERRIHCERNSVINNNTA